MSTPTDLPDQVRRLQDRLRVFSDAGRTFAETTTDYQRLLEAVARKVAEVVRDYCTVLILSPDGEVLTPLALYDPDPDALAVLRDVLADEPLALVRHPILRRVVDTGEPMLTPKVDPEQIRPHTTPRYYEFLKHMGMHSLLVVRLQAHGRCIGALTLGRFRPGSPSFDESALELAQSLADQAALAISNARSYEAERTAREALLASDETHRLLFEASPVPMYFVDAETLGFLAVNEAAANLYGYTRDEFLRLTVPDLRLPQEAAEVREIFRAAGESDARGTVRHRSKQGAVMDVRYTSRMLTLSGRRGRLTVLENVTERNHLEEQLRQSQKMDAIGRLAGGVAHDFNNLLSVILSYGALMLADLKPGEPMHADLEEICKAGKRAAELTHQLLTFSRQQVLAPKVLDLNDALLGMDKMLRRILGEDIDLASLPVRPLGRVRVDPGSIEQVIMNLAVNARDAMPTGGKLTLETDNVTLDDEYAKEHLGVKAGPHVMLAMTDTGAGMDKATLGRIFEPFFTTKEISRGTGLGLSTVFGIVQQSGGNIWVYSEVGRGTTFKVYLPRVDAEIEAVRAPAGPLLRGTETILLVEDEDQIRTVACGILRKFGYRVIEARNAGEALLLCEGTAEAIDLLLTDVVMPQMSGPELAKRLAAARPGMKVLCMSGYTDDSIVRHGVLEGEIAFLQKPITPDTLTQKVREVLDGPKKG